MSFSKGASFKALGAVIFYFHILLGFAQSTHQTQNVSEEYLGPYNAFDLNIKANSQTPIDYQALNREFESLVKKSTEEDKSCLNIVTGNDGEKSVEEIKKKFNKEGNVSEKNLKIKEYPNFMAKNFLSMLCNHKSLSSGGGFASKFQNVHPYQRSLTSGLDKKNDALSCKEFREPISKMPELSSLSSGNGIQNLIYGQSLVYSLALRESNTKLLDLNKEKFDEYLSGKNRVAAFQQKVGLFHQSANSLGTEDDMKRDPPYNTLYPYASELLNKYIKKARSLAKDTSPSGIRKFGRFCGNSHFESTYSEKKINPQEALKVVLSSTVEFKKKGTGEKKLLTCDEIIDDGVKSYDAGNVHSCYMALQEYCPNYSVSHANLVVRGMRQNNGPLRKAEKGLRPACHKLFYNIYDRVSKEEQLCKLTENFNVH